MLPESIGLSVILGFLASEFLGVSAGGLVSPGYLAFFLDEPLRLAATLVLATAIYFVMRLLYRFMIIYGKRRFMATMLLSILGTWAFERLFFSSHLLAQDIRTIGYIIPGLIANDMLRQGVVKTIVAALLCAAAVHFILMLAIAK
jgi:poly-gamma-glutamate biosynthesis protein PgsC/CapC